MDEEQVDFTFAQVSVHALDRILRDHGYRVQVDTRDAASEWSIIVYKRSEDAALAPKQRGWVEDYRTVYKDNLRTALQKALEYIGIEI